MPESSIPDGYHTITPYLIVHDGSAAIDFYCRALGATELFRLAGQDGRIQHAELKLGGSHIMLADEYPDMGFLSPKHYGGTPVSMHIYVDNVDDIIRQVEQAGAIIKRPVQDQFYGDRTGTIEDPFGHTWLIATHVEDVPEDEIKRRFDDMMKQHASS